MSVASTSRSKSISDLARRPGGDKGAAPSPGEKESGGAGTPGLLGVLSRFMFSPTSRTSGFVQSPTSAGSKTTQVSFPKTDSRGSITSEYFGDAEIDYAEVSDGSDAGEKTPRTPEPPNMRRNATSWGSFGSLSDLAQV
jgi:hypothetical protein